MAELKKWTSSQVLPVLRHNLRQFEDGNRNGNDDIRPELTPNNYSLIERGKTCKEVNKYRKEIEKECHLYKRKNLIHAVEVVIQCPADCPEHQKADFFQESFEHVCSTLPMGKRCVFVAEVHRDERHFAPDGTMISKDHLHIMYVPAVRDTKHPGFDYKLCADELTKRATLKAFHPSLQSHLDSKGIRATVFKKNGDGKSISFSVSQLKEITEKTGLKLDHSLSIDDFSKIISKNISAKKEKSQLLEKLHEKEHENLQIKEAAQKIIHDKNVLISSLQENLDFRNQENQHLQSELSTTQAAYNNTQQELLNAQEHIRELENKQQSIDAEKTPEWGSNEWKATGWGNSTGWGNTSEWERKTIDEEVDV